MAGRLENDCLNEEERWMIAFMDDASRSITCYSIFDSATTKNTIKVLKRGFAEYGTPDEILTDHEPNLLLQKAEMKPSTNSNSFLLNME